MVCVVDWVKVHEMVVAMVMAMAEWWSLLLLVGLIPAPPDFACNVFGQISCLKNSDDRA